MKHVNFSTQQKKSIRNWKIAIPLLALFLCLSCNKDDDEDIIVPTIPPIPSFVKVTVGGTVYHFDHFVVETQTVVEPDYTYVDLNVTGTMNGDDTKEISISLEQGATGNEAVYYFYLHDGEQEYDTDHAGAAFSTNVDINANRRIIGTFSGTLANFNDTETLQLQSGTFDISY